MAKVRVRFAPSPTGPLHIGGVRTALYNYLFARKHGGKFILRIEDTDRTRYVSGAEEYITESLRWLGLEFDEGFGIGGNFGPYRQSDRKDLYSKYAGQLVEKGFAYYAFDTPEELDIWREKQMAEGVHSPKYDMNSRMNMKNSLTLPKEEVDALIKAGVPYVVRLKIPEDELVKFTDIVRGDVQFQSGELDDKVMLKADGLPTYHLANIIDDHFMEISHVIRGEEWLSSTAHHVLLYRAFGWEDTMPEFAHLPLLLKPTGKGKLSKRDGAKFGFPVFPILWKGEHEGEEFIGFRDFGFLPEATINFLALLGWNPGDDREIMSKDELIDLFSLEKIVRSGARFDIEKAKWFNQQYLLSMKDEDILAMVKPLVEQNEYSVSDSFLEKLCELMKPRVNLLPEFITEARFFFEIPKEYEEKRIKKKWKSPNKEDMQGLFEFMKTIEDYTAAELEGKIKGYIDENELSFGNILPVLRIAVSGTMKGPDLFEIMALLGRKEVLNRIPAAFEAFDDIITSRNN